MTRMDAPDWQPSIASHLVAMSSRTTLRPLAQLMPSNGYGLAVMDRVLRTALVASRPRRGVTVRKVDTVFAGNPIRGNWINTPVINPHANPMLYIHGGAYSMCSPDTHRGLLGELAFCKRTPNLRRQVSTCATISLSRSRGRCTERVSLAYQRRVPGFLPAHRRGCRRFSGRSAHDGHGLGRACSWIAAP